MGGDLSEHRLSSRQDAAPRGAGRPTPTARPVQRILQLQAQAGNRAVRHWLTADPDGHQIVLQRDARSHPESPPVTDLHPTGTLSAEQWTEAYRAAVAAPSVPAFERLFHDIAVTSGMADLAPGFVPDVVPISDGRTARPGLNLTLSKAGNPGETAWVGQDGRFGVPFTLDKTDLSIAIILSPLALLPTKALSLATVRHEMAHARHKVKVLEAVKAWRSTGAKRPAFTEWLKRQKKMSAVDVALIGQAARDASADTEVLGHVEGFTTDFHRRAAESGPAGPAFFELLGVAETSKLFPWAQADPAVQAEALTRLREYHATLDAPHQRLWKEWLQKNLGTAAKDKTGRKDFLTRLAATLKS